MTEYEHDIFISYRRYPGAQDWVKAHLIPVMQAALSPDLGWVPDIYFDDRIDTGDTWNLELAEHLAKSRILVCLWSREYLASNWCACELNYMLQRESSAGMRSVANRTGLVAVATINDGETLPQTLGRHQHGDMVRFYNPFLNLESPLRADFFTEMKQHSVGLVKMIQKAPDYIASWETEATALFEETYSATRMPPETGAPQQFSPIRYTT